MTPEQQSEFENLIKRYKAAEQYEKTQYMQDTSEAKAWAEKEVYGIVKRLGQLWDIMTDEERHRNIKLI